jgi:hypothetical protein
LILLDICIIITIIIVNLWRANMRFITVSDLRLYATKIVHEVEEAGEEVIVTRNGRPVALIRRVVEEEFALKGERAEGSNNVKK